MGLWLESWALYGYVASVAAVVLVGVVAWLLRAK